MYATPPTPKDRASLARTLRSLRNARTTGRDPVTGAAYVRRLYTRHDLRRYATRARAQMDA